MYGKVGGHPAGSERLEGYAYLGEKMTAIGSFEGGWTPAVLALVCTKTRQRCQKARKGNKKQEPKTKKAAWKTYFQTAFVCSVDFFIDWSWGVSLV